MKQKKKEKPHSRVLLENPYDIETLLESLLIASHHGKDIIFMDSFTAQLRKNPDADITELSYNILRDLNLLKLEKI